MLQFVVFDADGMTAGNFPPRHAYVHGPDSLPLQSQIEFKDGLIACDHSVPHSTALAVQYEVPAAGSLASMGCLMLPTCLLPDRPEPYLLTIELARHQLMLFLNKLEDWGQTDMPSGIWVMRQFEKARAQFTEALVAQRSETGKPGVEPPRHGYRSEADRLAAQTLAMALDAGEGMTLMQAEKQIRERASGKQYADAYAHYTRVTQESLPPGSPIAVAGAGGVVLGGTCPIGCAVSPHQFSEGLMRLVQLTCDFVSMPMRWVDMEPSEGKYSFAATDRWIEWCVRGARLPVVAGPLVDFRPQSTPEWLYIWENDYETLRDLVIEHIQSVVTRYRRTVQRWTVASGLHVNTNFKVSFEQIMDLTRVCVSVVKKLHPTAKIQLDIAQPWGEYHATNRRSLPPLLYAEAVLQAGIPIDTLGLRLQMGHAEPGLATRDMLSMSALLDRYAQFDKPLAITALGVPSAPIPAQAYRPRTGAAAEDSYEPGWWRKGWDEDQQAEWMTQAMMVCCGKPYVQSVCWQELADSPQGSFIGAAPEMPYGGLVSWNGQLKPSGVRFAQVRAAIKEGKSPIQTG